MNLEAPYDQQLSELDKLFPFHFILDRDLNLVKTGVSLKKILPEFADLPFTFNARFRLIRPKNNGLPDWDFLLGICSNFVLIKVFGVELSLLKGQFEIREESDQLVFFGTLWVEGHEDMQKLGLTYSDFPAYDPIFDIQQMRSVLNNEQEDIKKLKKELDIINHSSDLFLHIHPSGLIRKASPSAKNILGYEPIELVGMPFQHLIADQDGLNINREIEELVNQEKAREFVTFLYTKSKEKVGVGMSMSPVKNELTLSTQIICVVRDISDRIRDLEEISNLASFPNENPNPIFRIDNSGKIKFRNRAANVMTHVVYDGRIHSLEKFWTHLLQLFHQKFPEQVDGIVDHRHYNFKIIERVDNNEYNVYGSDITERIESELKAQENFNRLNNFLESTNDVYYLIYQQNRAKNFFTSRWPLFLGFNPLQGDVWEQKRDCVIDEHKKMYDDAMREFQLNGTMAVKYKVRNKVTGHIRWIMEEAKIKFDSTLNDEIISGRLTDITANENYRNQVKESEERFQLITESMAVMIWVSDETNKVTYTNQASRDFYGIDLKFLKDQSEYASRVHPDFVEIAINDWSEKLKRREKCEMQYLVLDKSGEYRWVYEIALPRFLNDNQFLGYVGSAFDITNERKMFYSLEEEKKKYELISNKSADIIFLLSVEGVIEYVSPSINRILGLKTEEVVGMHIDHLIQGNSNISFKEIHGGGEKNLQKMFSFQMKDSVGENKWVEAVYNKFSEDELGEEKILMHVRDINEQYMAQTMLIENEAKYRNLFSNMNLGIMEVDRDEKILYINKSFERISGYSEMELLGKNAPDTFLIDMSEKEMNIQERRNREHGKEGLYEIKVRKKNGNTATWVISGAPTFDLKGRVRGSIGIHWDVTEIRDLETKILFESVQKEKELMEARLQAEEEQRDVIGRDLHDGVGQMLAYLSLYFNILKEKDLIQPDDIDKAQITIKKTIDEVRRLSRNLAPPAIKDLGFREAVIELVNSYGIIPKPVFSLKIYKGKDPDKFLHEHKIMMFRVIQELSSNTFKYAKAEHVDMKIEHDKKGMILSYCDDGIGFQLSTVKKGIGLKSILSRVEFYGGEVKINTNPGAGIEVLINLPFE